MYGVDKDYYSPSSEGECDKAFSFNKETEFLSKATICNFLVHVLLSPIVDFKGENAEKKKRVLQDRVEKLSPSEENLLHKELDSIALIKKGQLFGNKILNKENGSGILLLYNNSNKLNKAEEKPKRFFSMFFSSSAEKLIKKITEVRNHLIKELGFQPTKEGVSLIQIENCIVEMKKKQKKLGELEPEKSRINNLFIKIKEIEWGKRNWINDEKTKVAMNSISAFFSKDKDNDVYFYLKLAINKAIIESSDSCSEILEILKKPWILNLLNESDKGLLKKKVKCSLDELAKILIQVSYNVISERNSILGQESLTDTNSILEKILEYKKTLEPEKENQAEFLLKLIEIINLSTCKNEDYSDFCDCLNNSIEVFTKNFAFYKDFHPNDMDFCFSDYVGVTPKETQENSEKFYKHFCFQVDFIKNIIDEDRFREMLNHKDFDDLFLFKDRSKDCAALYEDIIKIKKKIAQDSSNEMKMSFLKAFSSYMKAACVALCEIEKNKILAAFNQSQFPSQLNQQPIPQNNSNQQPPLQQQSASPQINQQPIPQNNSNQQPPLQQHLFPSQPNQQFVPQNNPNPHQMQHPLPQQLVPIASAVNFPEQRKALAAYREKINLAKTEQHSNTVFTEVFSHPLIGEVFHNFYYIMKIENKIKVEHDDWGRIVFTKAKGWENYVQGIGNWWELDRYRLAAIKWVEAGKKANSESEAKFCWSELN